MENNGKNGNLQFFLVKKLNNLRKINSVETMKGLSSTEGVHFKCSPSSLMVVPGSEFWDEILLAKAKARR